LAEPVEVAGIGLQGATFIALPDAETNFTLFEPVSVSEDRQDPAGLRVLLAKVRPNEDISVAIEAICSRHGIENARVYGIGSLNEVRFSDGRRVESHATEILIDQGRVERTNGRPRAALRIDVVDVEGRISSGDLVHGDNPVCVTFELIIEDTGYRP
jgi:predicted DNA-binding protein with PD1-like motif